MTTLRDVKVGESCTVARLTGTGALKRRIMDMGLTKGTRVHVRKVAPLGDPLELTVRGYELSQGEKDLALRARPGAAVFLVPEVNQLKQMAPHK